MLAPKHLIALVGEASSLDDLGAMLERHGYQVGRVNASVGSSRFLPLERPALVIRAGAPGAAYRPGIPLLDIVEDGSDPRMLVDRHGDADDWVFRSRVSTELPARVARLLRRGGDGMGTSRGSPSAPIDSRFLAVAVHDLRTPLNVIGLSLRMIDQAIPRDDPDLLEDLRFVEDNFKQIERMLSQLGDFCRLYEPDWSPGVTEFSPTRMMGELVEDRTMKAGAGSPPLLLHVEESCPAEVVLDPVRARMAIQYVLSNAAASASEVPVDITLHGGPDRLITEVRIDRPPPPSVESVTLRPDTFERLHGTAAERRGLDLRSPRGSARCSAGLPGSKRSRIATPPSSWIGRRA